MEYIPAIVKPTDASEISSTTSKTKNQKAFYNKLRSRRYKCLITLCVSLISWFLIVWFGVLSRLALTILEKLDFDFTEMKQEIHELMQTRGNGTNKILGTE